MVERFNRTLKEQAIYGRVFRTVGDVRNAVLQFREQYKQKTTELINQFVVFWCSWRLEKLGYKTPLEAREQYTTEGLKQAAA